MKELTDEQVREMRARNRTKGKVEMPPVLTEEDEKLLDAALKEATAEVAARKIAQDTK